MPSSSKRLDVVKSLSQRPSRKICAKKNGIVPAIQEGQGYLVRHLLEMGASPTDKDDDGGAPIHVAGVLRHWQVVRTLVLNRADVNEPDRNGCIPLHLAIALDDEISVRALLAEALPLETATTCSTCALLISPRGAATSV